MHISSPLLFLLPLFSMASRSFATPIPSSSALASSEASLNDWSDVAHLSTSQCTNGASCITTDSVQALEDEEADKDEESLVPTPPGTTTRFTIYTLVLLSALSVAGISYFVYASPSLSLSAPLLREKLGHGLMTLSSLLSPVRKYMPIPTSFRVGEHRLVRWAQEDMGLLEMSDDEQDVMVNGMQSFEVIEEDIPLKPSPGIRRGVFTNYGSAWR